MNVKPGASFTAYTTARSTANLRDPGLQLRVTLARERHVREPEWLGAGASPQYISVGAGSPSATPAATVTTQLGINNLPHPNVGPVWSHLLPRDFSRRQIAIGYDHLSPLINTNCGSCHEAGTNLIGTLWNGATAQASGAGDSRPITLASVTGKRPSPTRNHFYRWLQQCMWCRREWQRDDGRHIHGRVEVPAQTSRR